MDPIKRKLQLLDQQIDERRSLHNRIFTNSPILLPALGFIVGIILQNRFHVSFALPLVLLAIIATSVSILIITRKKFPALYITACAACLCFACLGAIRITSFYQPAPNDIRNFVSSDRTLAIIGGTVTTEPKTTSKDDWLFGRYSWTPPATSFYLKLSDAKTDPGWAAVTGTVRIQISGELSGIHPGDHIKAYCWLSRFSPSLNPGQFDVKKYMNRRGVFISASVSTPDGIELLQTSGPSLFAKLKTKLRTIVTSALLGESDPDKPDAQLIATLILGQRSYNTEVFEAFRETGLAHFICLSGMHFGILVGFLWYLARLAGLSKPSRAAVCMFLTVLYVCIIPPRPATLRAAVICWFFCVSIIIRKKPNALNTLSLAAIVLLYFRPADLFDPGFQLSYLTVLGILTFYRYTFDSLATLTIDKFPKPNPDKKQHPLLAPARFLLRSVIELLAIGISAWLGGAGILLYHFATITPLSALWTILVFPLVMAILLLGFLKILLAALLPTVAMIVGMLATSVTGALIWAVTLLASLDISQILIGSVPLLLIAAFYAFLLFARFVHLKSSFLKSRICLAGIVAICLATFAIKYHRTHRDHLEITCLSIGHGQAILAQLPGTTNLLFDAGSLTIQNPGQRIINPFLRHNSISSIDAIFVSHDDIDHINAIPEIVTQNNIKKILANGATIQQTQGYSSAAFLNKFLATCNLAIEPLHDHLPPTSPVRITPLWPDEKTAGDITISDNDRSQVTLIEFADRKILLTSDIEIFAQAQILQNYPDLDLDILVMPHHGSKANLIDEFAEKLKAETVIISCSKARYANAYHPPENINALYTPVDGAITIKIKADGTISTTGFRSQ